ncbi:MAG TPA: hypothetical protein ENH37_13345 [Deltaproteobacteria bacterium]|nr:hypothetical protein [Deltaproteobacteria bacterium]
MKRLLIVTLLSLFASATLPVYGADEADSPPIYVSIVMHNEEPAGGGYPDFVEDQRAFFRHRKALLRFVKMLHKNGVMFNFQSDWNFLKAVALYDRGTPETGGKNIVRYMREDLGFEVDPHAHETLYNYADVAYLIKALGVEPSGTVGGFQALPPANSRLEYLWQPITGRQYPEFIWEAQVLWGGATLNHVNEELLWVSGVWKPEDNHHFLEHDDAAPLPHIGGFGRGWEKLGLLLKMQQSGELEQGRIHTCTIFVTQSKVLKPAFIREFEGEIKAHDQAGDLAWTGLAQVAEIWRSEYGSSPAILPYLEVAGGNLLSNPGVEQGTDGRPLAWTPRTLAGGTENPVFVWEAAKSSEGRFSLRIENMGFGGGMWQQVVQVAAGTVYTLSGYVGFENVIPPGRCNLQVVFRDKGGNILEFVDLPFHDGTRPFELDYPSRLKFRAPAHAATAEVNCFLQGPGVAWFDDLFFGPALSGKISGRVISEGGPVDGARVWLMGDPWGRVYEAYTDQAGRYLLEHVPVAFPRYVMMAEREGFRSRPAGDVAVRAGESTRVDFELFEGRNPVDLLRVKFACLGLNYHVAPNQVPTDALIPIESEDYPESIREYLKSDRYITSHDPAVVALADQILSSLDPATRKDTYAVAWAVYEWVAKNISHDAVFGEVKGPYMDVTSGIYQTILGGWAWGRNFYGWCYRPAQTVALGSAICVEHAWLSAALLRALGIPARVSVGSTQFWVQRPGEYGYWVGLSTSSGSNAYREHGVLGPGFGGLESPAFFSVTSEPVLHEDWSIKGKCLWHEKHPWSETYPGTEEGLALALDHMDRFMVNGTAPKGLPSSPESDRFRIYYRDVTIDLNNVDGPGSVDIRFPLVSESEAHHDMKAQAYWSNHPECIERTYVEEITNPPVEGKLRWFHIVFDLTRLVGTLDLTW